MRRASAFAYALTPSVVVRGGYGTSFAHYTRAGSGDILAINAPNALFVSVTATYNRHRRTVIAPSTRDSLRILPRRLAPGTDNITYVPKDTKDSYVESYFLEVQKELAKNTLVDIAYIGNPRREIARLPECKPGQSGTGIANPTNPALGAGFVRPYPNWGRAGGHDLRLRDITEALKRILVALQTRSRCAMSSDL